MNLEAIKQKLSALNNAGSDREKVDYEALFWKPTLGKHQVRIVPSKFTPDFPFTELKFHYRIGKFPMISLTNFGKQDPVEDFVKELRKTSDRENWSLSGKIEPRGRIFAPVIVRGEEAKGVRLWGFGVNIYKALLALAEDEDIGDYTDTMSGYDMIVEQTAGNPYPQTTVRLKPKSTSLSTDAAQAQLWLTEQPNPLDSFTQYDYDFIKKKLQEYLAPDAGGETIPATTAEPNEPVAASGKFQLLEAEPQTQSQTSKTVTSFDDLFN
jgi:hypothetical protein